MPWSLHPNGMRWHLELGCFFVQDGLVDAEQDAWQVFAQMFLTLRMASPSSMVLDMPLLFQYSVS